MKAFVSIALVVALSADCPTADPSSPEFELAIAGLHHWTGQPGRKRHISMNMENRHRRAGEPTFWVVLTNRSKRTIRIWTHFTEPAIQFQFRRPNGEVVSITANPNNQGLRLPIYMMELGPGEPYVFPIEFRDRFWRNIPREVPFLAGDLRASFTIEKTASRQPDFWSGTVVSRYIECQMSGGPRQEAENLELTPQKTK